MLVIYYEGMEVPIGKVTHYYGKAGVAVVTLTAALKVGDRIKIKNRDREWEQEVTSMEVDRQPVNESAAGSEVALKVSDKTHEGALLIIEK